MTETAQAGDEAIRFEDALERLEVLVDAIEAGDLDLEDSLRNFEEGVRLVRLCSEQLRAAEVRVRELETSADGVLRETPIEAEGDA